VASALSLGAKAVEVATGEATKDAYKALKAKVTAGRQVRLRCWRRHRSLVHGRPFWPKSSTTGQRRISKPLAKLAEAVLKPRRGGNKCLCFRE
jgi:hypothetical protein